ncbi:hypothetical protein BJV82DRAFT_672592 [Fennellomyces sp. T-0311]|nr:hypothetical protein BJV82DRAFT_672592 [Fennellomyces sp. T-0311]
MGLIQSVRRAFFILFSCCLYTPIKDSNESDQDSTSKSVELREITPPKDPQQYLHSGNIYVARGNPQAALQVYQIGLRWAMLDEAKRDALQKEIRKVSATIDRQRKIEELDPANVWSTIFGYLKFNELLHCACVSRAWRNFIIRIPRFRHQLPIKIFQREELVSWSLSDKRKFPVIEVCGPLVSYHGMDKDIFKFLSCWNYTSSQRLAWNHKRPATCIIVDQSTINTAGHQRRKGSGKTHSTFADDMLWQSYTCNTKLRYGVLKF